MNIIIREIIKNVKKLLPEAANITVENIDKINEKKTAVIVSDVWPIPKHGNEEESSLLYVSNDCGIDGAATILYAQDVLEELCNKRKKIFMLPSSIHEFLIVADEKEYNVEQLKCIVREVNQTALEPGDFLSDSVYGYSKERGIYIV